MGGKLVDDWGLEGRVCTPQQDDTLEFVFLSSIRPDAGGLRILKSAVKYAGEKSQCGIQGLGYMELQTPSPISASGHG